MLAVVEHQQPEPALQRGGHRLAHSLARLLGNAQHGGHGVGHRTPDRSPQPVRKTRPRRGTHRPAAPRPRWPGGSCRPRPHRSTSPADEPCTAACTSSTSDSRPMKLVVAGRRFPGLVSSARSDGNSVRRPVCSYLEHPDRHRHIPQPARPQIDQVHSAEQNRRRLGQQDLTAVTGGHHPRSPIQHRTEVVAVAQFGFAGRDPHPHRQLQRPLRSHRGIDRRPGRRECGTHPVTGVLEQPTAVRLDRRAQHLVMCGEGLPHRIRVCLPPTGRTLDIGEQKRHNPRRRAPCGHPHRMSHQAHYDAANRD